VSAARLRLAVPAGLGLLLAGCTPPPPPDIPQVGSHELKAEVGWEPPAPMQEWAYIVVHHSATAAGSAATFHRHHQGKGWEGLGYHFVIGNGSETPDGFVEVGYRWTRQLTGAHVGGDNNIGKIGVCLVGNLDAATPTSRQMASLHKLLEFLQVRCGIPSSRVRGHSEVTRPGYTHCPGQNLPMPDLRSGLLREPPPYDPAAVRLGR
jgi:N-acetyl-anhydromuramyl-L-alanine amidase AmpD